MRNNSFILSNSHDSIFESLGLFVSFFFFKKEIFETREYNYILFSLKRASSLAFQVTGIFYTFERYDRALLLELNTFPEDVTCKGRQHFDTNLSNQEGARWNTKVAGATKCWNSR